MGVTGRIVIDRIAPPVAGAAPAKAIVGRAVPVAATVFRDGHGTAHDRLCRSAADCRWCDPVDDDSAGDAHHRYSVRENRPDWNGIDVVFSQMPLRMT